ncbi:LacI family DNA-binding transcriptional regulator [Tropicimonas sp. IMCC34043]|uniref:LacI family DNA-binding transcriptional regulator n=1 Tax=Tropicimonas sp. IMCC34043 TaxID=2248760 RepID=UPI0018E53F10|nr:LacI family DNA-binding transcriptional regulator [Tropicimonas sp. IMCC34043]
MNRRRSTIKDVAREAGVSVSAVSRAFSGGSLSADKKTRILQVAGTLDYRPSSAAQSLVRQQTRSVTLVTGRMHDPFDSQFLEALAEALADSGRRLIVAPASKQADLSGGVYQAIDDRSDAVIIAAGTMPLDASRACVRIGLPVILAGRILDTPGVDAVVAANCDGGRQAAAMFLRGGCQRPAWFGVERPSFSNDERLAGFHAQMAAAGIEPARFEAGGRDDEAIFEAASRMLSRSDRPDAVFCATDRLAFGVLEAAGALRLAVPRDLAVIGFNNVPAAARRSYRLTTLDYPVARVVAEIMEILEARLAAPGLAPIRRRIPVSLIVRETTR